MKSTASSFFRSIQWKCLLRGPALAYQPKADRDESHACRAASPKYDSIRLTGWDTVHIYSLEFCTDYERGEAIHPGGLGSPSDRLSAFSAHPPCSRLQIRPWLATAMHQPLSIPSRPESASSSYLVIRKVQQPMFMIWSG